MSRDNWERLVEAVLRKEHDRETAMAPSRDPSNLSSASSALDHSFRSTYSQFHHQPAIRKKTIWPAIPFAWWRPRKQPAEEDYYPEVYPHLKRFSLRELQIATDNFSNQKIVGRVGFGKVHKGRLADGSFIAVKIFRELTQGEEFQFQREVEVLSQAVHRNIVRLLGFCTTPTERMLVYSYFANGSVASSLRDRPENEPPLDWPTRKRIALGSARALSYLHDRFDPKLIHRAVKAANILLDEEFEAALGGFRLARFIDDGDHAVRGTLEHIDPEYLSTGIFSEKTDVYGYGVMLLELITGQRAFDLPRLANDDDDMLLDWVKGLLKKKKLEIVVDPDLQKNYVEAEVVELIKIALLCTQSDPMERPEMSEVVSVFVEGDELAKRWDELQEEEEKRRQEWAKLQLEEKYRQETDSDWNVYDDTENLQSIELSSPR